VKNKISNPYPDLVIQNVKKVNTVKIFMKSVTGFFKFILLVVTMFTFYNKLDSSKSK
jgi:hypothetical protein